mmetsp:Transcript_857/g.1037  ORF Transcript_857/g.1037 Transcript_857/m.1037 type:complete len:209 (+) Transcript_857:105-731(+)
MRSAKASSSFVLSFNTVLTIMKSKMLCASAPEASMKCSMKERNSSKSSTWLSSLSNRFITEQHSSTVRVISFFSSNFLSPNKSSVKLIVLSLSKSHNWNKRKTFAYSSAPSGLQSLPFSRSSSILHSTLSVENLLKTASIETSPESKIACVITSSMSAKFMLSGDTSCKFKITLVNLSKSKNRVSFSSNNNMASIAALLAPCKSSVIL